MKRMRVSACFLLFAILCACSGPGEIVYTSVAPDGLRVVTVHARSGFGDSAVTVMADRTPIAGANDCAVEFAHAAWRGSVVSVFVDGLWCGKIRVAYDTATGKPVDFASTKDWLCRDIVAVYQITPQELAMKNGDVLAWIGNRGFEGLHRVKTDFQTLHRTPPQRTKQ